jgi:integrase
MENSLCAAREERDQFYPECEAVFAYEGKRPMDLKRAWKTACEKANVNGLLFHDMGRSANRNMRDAGLPRSMRMKIMGHKTASVERRYGIVHLTDIQIARELLAKKPAKADLKTAYCRLENSDALRGSVSIPSLTEH